MFLHLVFCNLSIWLRILQVWKKVEDNVCFFSPKQIITNYMSAHIWALPALISIILWCNRISWVSSTRSLNVTLGRRSDLPWRWLAHCSCEEGIDRSSKLKVVRWLQGKPLRSVRFHQVEALKWLLNTNCLNPDASHEICAINMPIVWSVHYNSANLNHLNEITHPPPKKNQNRDKEIIKQRNIYCVH